MPRTGRDAAHMARMRSRRRAFTEPRVGRLTDQIRFAFLVSAGAPLTTSQLVDRCYGVHRILDGERNWYRSNVRRAALSLAYPCGHSRKRGRPLLWAPREPIGDTPYALAMRKLISAKVRPCLLTS
jgi:hypothetical protein